jgi:hypothetical protein
MQRSAERASSERDLDLASLLSLNLCSLERDRTQIMDDRLTDEPLPISVRHLIVGCSSCNAGLTSEHHVVLVMLFQAAQWSVVRLC